MGLYPMICIWMISVLIKYGRKLDDRLSSITGRSQVGRATPRIQET